MNVMRAWPSRWLCRVAGTLVLVFLLMGGSTPAWAQHEGEEEEEEHGEKAVNLVRYEEAMETGADTLAVGCPFCMQMFETAKSEHSDGPVVRDVAEMLAEQLEKAPAAGD